MTPHDKEEDRFDFFLTELRRLSEETGLVIAGCGCCGSPSIKDISGLYLEIEGHYEVDEYFAGRYTLASCLVWVEEEEK